MSGALHYRSIFAAAEAALSFAGAGIAGTLWWADRTQQDVPCRADGGCEIVAASRWSHVDLIVFPHVPVALLGLLAYVLLLTLAMLRLGAESARLDRSLHQWIWLVSGGGLGYSWYLQWIAHAEIGAFCPWCRASAVIMTLLFLTVSWEGWVRRQRSHTGQEIHG